VAPLALAGVLAAAGGLKLGDRRATVASFSDLGLPAPRAGAIAVPVVELAVATALVVTPVVGALAALILLGGFSLFLGIHLHRGTEAPCACFGRAHASPITGRDLARNAVLGLLALVTIAAPPG
jgi:uncharacterized membrane protein YphA (DoxX/SURF4 family)